MRKILVVDDNESIHKDIESILSGNNRIDSNELFELESELFGHVENSNSNDISYRIDHAYQGLEAIEMVAKASKNGEPYTLVFMDVRMPPGIDGVETINRIWKEYPLTEMVICTAYSDYSWTEILDNLGKTDHLLFMRKPFDATALKQTALSLTTKWQLQQETVSYTENLEIEVDKRTRELNELVKEFKSLKEIAEKASAAKSEFLANVSHEIRTPMNGILGMNNLLMDSDLTNEQIDLAEMVKYSAEALLYIINDILDFSKIEAGKMQIESIPFNLRELVQNLQKILQLNATAKNLNIGINYDKSIPDWFVGDPTRIRQVLMNFGNNAIKFTDKGIVQFNILILENLESSKKLRFEVIDSGVGIPLDKQKILFKPFSQADSSTSRKYGGTGLGLAICKQISDLMNGDIGFMSKEGNGATFWFEVTLDSTVSLENNGQNEKEIVEELSINKELSEYKILVAEDNVINQKVIKLTLEREGYKIDIAEHGEIAVTMAKETQYDIIFMDVHMPLMDGYEATVQIRQNEKENHRHVPIIAFTASVLQDDMNKCLKVGMDDFIAKPVEKYQLINTLNKWLM